MASINPVSSSGLRAFPPEIRKMIYDFGEALSWTGKTPALIVALRGDQDLYHEALDLFYRNNAFALHQANAWKTGGMSISALQTIQTLNVDFWSSDDWEEWDTAQIIEPSTHDFGAHPIIAHASNLHSVHFNVSAMSEHNMQACLLPAVTCALQLPRLRRITVDLPRISYRRANDPYDSSGCVADFVRGFNRDLAIEGRLLVVGTSSRQKWFWEAERGRTLWWHVRSAVIA